MVMDGFSPVAETKYLDVCLCLSFLYFYLKNGRKMCCPVEVKVPLETATIFF